MEKLPENECFYCKHILEVENLDLLLASFVIKRESGVGLEQYLKMCAVEEEKIGEARTYLVLDKETGELVGYFTLKTGMVSINERVFLFKREFDSLSGIELSNFAVNDAYRDAHPEYDGVGLIIFTFFVLPIVKMVSRYVGVYLLFIFALPYKGLIEYYEKMNFRRLSLSDEYFLHRRLKPRYDRGCIFMSQRV